MTETRIDLIVETGGAEIPTDIDLNFCRAALDWNLGHAEKSPQTRLSAHIDFKDT